MEVIIAIAVIGSLIGAVRFREKSSQMSSDALLVELLQVGGLNKWKRTGLSRHSPEYKAYLKSPQWEVKRQLVLERDHYQCCFCGTDKNLQIHHKRYDNLGCEPLEDLATFCKSCHQAGHRSLNSRHFKGRKSRAR